MPEVHWLNDVDGALAEARDKHLPLFMDFNAAPM